MRALALALPDGAEDDLGAGLIEVLENFLAAENLHSLRTNLKSTFYLTEKVLQHADKLLKRDPPPCRRLLARFEQKDYVLDPGRLAECLKALRSTVTTAVLKLPNAELTS